MNKYFQVFKTSLQEIFTYRLSFLLWKTRSVLGLLASYFTWLAIFQGKSIIAGYTSKSMFAYVFGIYLLSELIANSESINIGEEISSGDLSNYLLKPINYFYYWFSRDLASKVMSAIFAIIIIFFLFILFKPVFFFNQNIFFLPFFLFSVFFAIALNFYLNILISFFSFWYPEHSGWPHRFFLNIVLTFLLGMYFPLDIFPKIISQLLTILPTAYILYFPLQIYLGKISNFEIFWRMLVMFFWTILLIKLSKSVWTAGLKKYSSEGR